MVVGQPGGRAMEEGRGAPSPSAADAGTGAPRAGGFKIAATSLASRKGAAAAAAPGPVLRTLAEEEEEEEERRRRRAGEKRVIPCLADTLVLGGKADAHGGRRRVPGFVPERHDDDAECGAAGFEGRWDVERDETAQGPARALSFSFS